MELCALSPCMQAPRSVGPLHRRLWSPVDRGRINQLASCLAAGAASSLVLLEVLVVLHGHLVALRWLPTGGGAARVRVVQGDVGGAAVLVLPPLAHAEAHAEKANDHGCGSNACDDCHRWR
eukprot:scaffold27789_cov48-Phaeocystis_antarctica.AAC.4